MTPLSFPKIIVNAPAVEAARSGTEPYELVQSINDFVKWCIDEFHYTRDEISQKALQAYCADYYLAEVNNRGHSQFIHNCRASAEFTFRDACAGLTSMGAPHSRILKDMMQWVEANPKEVAAQGAFEPRSPYLGKLDDEFDDLEKLKSMIDYSAQWIFSWPELQIVPDDSYLNAMSQCKAANSKYMDRHLLKIVQKLEFDSTDETRVAIGLALTNLPEPETLVKLGGGFYTEIEGRQQVAFIIETNKGKRKIVLGDSDVRLFEYFDGNAPKLNKYFRPFKVEKILALIQSLKYREPSVGRRIAIVTQQSVADAIEVSKANLAGAAVGLLLVWSRQIIRHQQLRLFPRMPSWTIPRPSLGWFLLKQDS